jgi:lysophospholipase L1-like esterase
MKRFLLILLLAGTSIFRLAAQDPARFQGEVDRFRADTVIQSDSGDLVLFTGSSSIRMWEGLKTDFPNNNLVNTGFGGSHMSDLLFYADLLIVRYHPAKVIIYEGDNDIEYGTSVDSIISHAGKLVALIRSKQPDARIWFISAKPSLARWRLSGKYLALNKALKSFARRTRGVQYINIWDVMLTAEGKPRPELFLDDGLHLNRKGYDIWREAVGKAVGLRTREA